MEDDLEGRRDLSVGVPLEELCEDVMLGGHVNGVPAVMVQHGGCIYAFADTCSHYGSPLSRGLVIDGAVRCPLHHARFSVATGEAIRAPALDPIPCWRVEVADGKAIVGERLAEPHSTERPLVFHQPQPRSIVIVGGGAAGVAAAEMLRRVGFQHRLAMVCSEAEPPCDRPNLSKDYLAGHAPAEWMAVRPPEFYTTNDIELHLGRPALELDTATRRLVLQDGVELNYDSLLLATGAKPVQLDIPGCPSTRPHYLRSFADGKALLERAGHAKHALLVGAGFLGLEVAASLASRGICVDVVAPGRTPMEPIVGVEAGRWLQRLHEAQGVRFRMGATVRRMDGETAFLTDGQVVHGCDLIVVAVGARPETTLAERAGLAVDQGILVDANLQTSMPGVYAAGDVARWPYQPTGEHVRIEHWSVALSQGQAVALNMLGAGRRYGVLPYFWSQHYDVTLHVVGHQQGWDRVDVEGSLELRDAQLNYWKGGRLVAVATVGRDLRSLQLEADLDAATRSGARDTP